MSSHRALAALSGWRIPHPEPLVDCELLLHFDQSSPTGWRDYSIKKHPVTALSVFPPGGIIADPDGYFRGGMQMLQKFPGNPEEPNFNTQTYVQIGGNEINLAAEEFFMSVMIKIAAYPPSGGAYVLASTAEGVSGNNLGWHWLISESGGVGFSINGGAVTGGGVVPLDTWTQVATSRKNQPLQPGDLFTAFIDGVVQQTISPTRNTDLTQPGVRTLIGAYDVSTVSDVVKLTDGFQGLMDELIIGKGDGWGIDTDFTPLQVPYNQRNRLPPFTG